MADRVGVRTQAIVPKSRRDDPSGLRLEIEIASPSEPRAVRHRIRKNPRCEIRPLTRRGSQRARPHASHTAQPTCIHLNAVDPVRNGTQLEQSVNFRCQTHEKIAGVVAVSVAADQFVNASSAVEFIACGAAERCVIALTAQQQILTGAAKQRVGTVASDQQVASGRAGKAIAARSAVERVVAGTAVENVITRSAGEYVVPVAAQQAVLTGVTGKLIISPESGQNVVAVSTKDKVTS